MTLKSSSSFLRSILLVDAVTCAAVALLLIVAADMIELWLTIPVLIQRISIVILLPFAMFVAYTATRPSPANGAIWFVIIGNAGWVLASLALLFFDGAAFNLAGKAFIGMQAAAVMLLAELEFFGLRKSGVATA